MPGKISTFCLDIEEESKVNDNVEIGQDDQKDGNIEENDGSVNDVKGDDDKEDDGEDEGDKDEGDKNEDDKDEDDWFDAQEEIDTD